MRFICKSLCILFLFTAATSVAWASITGSISGIVTDASGAVMVDVTVTAINIQTGVRNVVKTDAKGFYSFPSLDIGTYEIEIQQSGFNTYRKSGLVIDANSALRVDAVLQVGSNAVEVTVRSDAVQVETQSTQGGEVITGTRMTTVPLNGRSYTDLLSLQPGVVPSAYGSQAPGLNDRKPSGGLNSGNESVNGQREASNGFMVNGANVVEGKNNGASVIPNLDSISEFRIITNNFDAEYGNYSGGQINVATKSGTNQIHGTAFEFLRNTALDARNFFDPVGSTSAFKQNQFGGTLGAPIKKDKLFFFADYQGTRQTTGNTVNASVPTGDERGGNFLASANQLSGVVNGPYWASVLQNRLGQTVSDQEPYYTPGCTSTSVCVFPGGVIPQSAWSPAAAKLLQYVPAATNSAAASGAFNYNPAAPNSTLRDDKAGIRTDWNTRLGTIFAYYFVDDYLKNDALPNGGATVPGYSAVTPGRAQLLNLGDTKTIGSSAVNEFHVSFTRNAAKFFSPQGGLGPTLSSLGFTTPSGSGSSFNGGIGSVLAQLQGVPNIGFSNFTIGIPTGTTGQYNNTYQIQDNFSKVIGTHSLRFGGQFHYDQINERNYYDENGGFNFDGSETGNDFADFLIGAPVGFTQATQQILDSRSKYVGLFAQDSWRVRPSLTLNLGVRWEVSQPWYDTQNKTETIIPGEQSVVFPNAPKGWLVPGDPGVPSTLAPTKYNAFSPRLGLAWSPNVSDGFLSKITGGPGKMSIRMGYGMFYTAVEDLSQFLEVGDAPYGVYWSPGIPDVLENPYISRVDGSITGQPFPFTFPPTNVSAKNPFSGFNWASVEPISSGFVFWHQNRMPYSEHYDLSIQRQLGSNTLFSVSYVGNQGHRLVSSIEANPGSASLCLYLIQVGATPTCGPNNENVAYTLPLGVAVPAGAFAGPDTPTGQHTITGTRTTLDPAAFGSNPYMKEIANSAYNSLQTTLKHSSGRGEFLIGYTYSRCFDNSSGLQDTTNPFNPQLSRSLCSFDVTHNFVTSYSANLELDHLFHADSGAAHFIASGWQLSGIATFATGLPITMTENHDNSLTGAVGVDLPNYVPGNGPLLNNTDPRSGQTYFNTSLFFEEGCTTTRRCSNPTLGTIGNSNRRFFHGPGLNNWDMALLKTLPFTESKNLELRFEAFNIFNHAQFENPNGNVDSSSFGKVSRARAGRIMQIGAKFHF